MANFISTDQFQNPEDPALVIIFETQLLNMNKEENMIEDEPFRYPAGSTPPTETYSQEDETTDNHTTVSSLSVPLVNPNKNWSLCMLATLHVESEIEIAQAQAVTLSAMNSATEVERLKKESDVITLQKAKEDTVGGETIREALENHLNKKFVSRKSLMKLLASILSDNQHKNKNSLKVGSNKRLTGQGQ